MASTENDTALKIGELATRSGLTVRALHHYDSIGLLHPSTRDSAGYRLYDRADVARLQQIQALRGFGMPLAEIGALLNSPDASFAEVVAQQIAALGQQIEQASALREQLSQLHRKMAGGAEPELADWLSTLELMKLYDKYFSKEELRRLPFWQQDTARNRDWPVLVADIAKLMEQGQPSASLAAQKLSLRWMQLLERDTAANPEFARRISTMLDLEPSAQQHTGITPALKQYVIDAFAAFKLGIYARYLNPDELHQMRANAGTRTREWIELVAQAHRLLEAGAAPGDPAAQQLAREWMTLFSSSISDHPDTLAKLRAAQAQEPALLIGTWMTEQLLGFIRQAAALRQ